MKRDFTYIDDIVDGILGAMKNRNNSNHKINDEHRDANIKKLIQNLNSKLNTVEKIRKFIILDVEPS